MRKITATLGLTAVLLLGSAAAALGGQAPAGHDDGLVDHVEHAFGRGQRDGAEADDDSADHQLDAGHATG